MKWIVYSLLLFSTLCAKTVEIIPTNADQTETLFSASIPVWDRLKEALEERGITVDSTGLDGVPKKLRWYHKYIPWNRPKRDVDLIISMNLPYFIHHQKLYNIPKEKLILFMLEPPPIAPDQYTARAQKKFAQIFTFDDDLVDNQRYFKFYYPIMHPMIEEPTPFQNRKFSCMINANKTSDHPDQTYTLREEAINFFESYPGKFDLYGWGWGDKNYLNYRGAVENKIDTLQHYRFCICYENTCSMKGYISEKIFDCFSAGCIPVYLGATNVEQFIPEDCFIDKRDFATYEALLAHLESLTDHQCETYLENIRTFLNSDRAKLFTDEHFVNTVVKAIQNTL